MTKVNDSAIYVSPTRAQTGGFGAAWAQVISVKQALDAARAAEETAQEVLDDARLRSLKPGRTAEGFDLTDEQDKFKAARSRTLNEEVALFCAESSLRLPALVAGQIANEWRDEAIVEFGKDHKTIYIHYGDIPGMKDQPGKKNLPYLCTLAQDTKGGWTCKHWSKC